MSDQPIPTGPVGAGDPIGDGSPIAWLGQIFAAPARVFGAIARRPRWVVALVALVLISVAAQVVITPRIDMERTIRDSMSERGTKLSDAQMDRAVEQAKKFSKLPMLVTPVMAPVILLLIAGIYFLGLRALGSEVEFKPVFSTYLHAAWAPGLVSAALGCLVAIKRGSFTGQEAPDLLRSSVGAWLPASTPHAVKAFAGVIDIFNVWQWILLIIGFEIVAKVKRSTAITVVAVVWGFWALVKVALAMLRGAF